MVNRFSAYEQSAANPGSSRLSGRLGVLMALATTIDARADGWRSEYPEHRTWNGKDLAFVPTVFHRLDRRLCRLLVYRGWWLTGATLGVYHPALTRQPVSPPPVG
jgi:NTE family protein